MPCDPNTQNCRAIGKVSRIYANRSGAFIHLADLPAADVPGGEEYFELQRAHPNYNALYSLVLVAATNGYDLHIRTSDPIDPASSENSVVSYLVVDW
jgi:hypothetical protein